MLICLLAIGFGVAANAQAPKKVLSPKDSVAATTQDGVAIKIVYSRPSLRGRDVNTLAPLGKVWRTGANAATTFEVSQNVTIGGKTLPAGKYSLYTIPGESSFTLIFNKVWDQWGTNYDQSSDAIRVNAPTTKSADQVEQFTISLTDAGVVTLSWSDWSVAFTVSKA